MLERSLKYQAKEAKDARTIEKRETILGWLSATEHEQKHHDVRVRRMDGTGNWLLQDKQFQRWCDEPKSRDNVLWCHGIQGSGKVDSPDHIFLFCTNSDPGKCDDSVLLKLC